MTGTVYLLIHGAAVSWLAPAPLSWLTRRGTNPRLCVAAWLTAMAAVVVSWIAAMIVVVVPLVGDGPSSSMVVLCLELLGVPERVATLGPVGTVGLLAVGLGVSTVVALGVTRTMHALRIRSAEHADAARMVGTPTAEAGVVVVSGAQRAAYCVVGRPHAIVLTTAAVAALDGPQLEAVLAHERAHLVGRHHHLLMVLRALAARLAHLPVFTRGAAAVAELLEMCADDHAARRHGPRPLVAGMLALASPAPPAGGLAVASTATAVRAHRLLEPAHRSTRWCHRAATSAVIAVTIALPVVVNLLCHH
ncbi:M56 family metallopeptidase [Mycobacterium yunnanensis]|uniref:M56 family metallopeptidase n=1 Tax=Mycobacterium yunnanensis TaxID=368477 RepID=A0A9X2Z7Q8_9MYCO|nr:M56 family metallopeptidase [Mycobacterium yunnanensis]MCV7424630.1 M56 family metallopeptidase [Mycobacterium yunnanensis]